ncbi:hypothetical protein ACJ41O_000619 [Fusarium nematophilum]
MSLPLKAKVSVRDNWAKADCPAQKAIKSLKDVLGLDVHCEPEWPILVSELDKAYEDKNQLVASVATFLHSWFVTITELLEDSSQEEWTEKVLSRISETASRLNLIVEVSESDQASTGWSDAQLGFVLSLPNTQVYQPAQFAQAFKDQLLDCFEEKKPAKSLPIHSTTGDEWADLAVEEASETPARQAQTVKSVVPAVEYLPNPNTMPKPGTLLQKPPYHLIIYAHGKVKVEIECSHGQTLEVLAEYLKKWCRMNPNLTNKPPAVTITLNQGACGFGLVYDTLTLFSENRYGGIFTISPTMILNLVEGVLGIAEPGSKLFLPTRQLDRTWHGDGNSGYLNAYLAQAFQASKFEPIPREFCYGLSALLHHSTYSASVLQMASATRALPAELVLQVLQNVGHSENGRSTITSCLLVSRDWRDAALSVLYRDLVLRCGSDRMDRFLTSHDGRAVRHITRSLTLVLRLSNTSYKRANTQVLRLARDAIAHMAELESFSLAQHHRGPGLPIIRSTISTVLKALPASCVNLELATGNGDADQLPGIDSDPTPAHLCEDLRRLLPRMHHVHINLGSVCDAMLGAWEDGSGQVFRPISLPHIQSLHVDCTGIRKRRVCDNGHPQHPPASLWDSIIRGLQLVVGLQETATAAEITVLGSSPRSGDFRHDIYWTLLRCHVRSGDGTTTWAFPITNLPRPNDGSKDVFYMRTDSGPFVTFGPALLYDLAGGRPWRMLTTGSKVPAAWDPHAARVSDEEVGILTWAEWHERYPMKKPVLSLNEERTGMRLLDAEERKGL